MMLFILFLFSKTVPSLYISEPCLSLSNNYFSSTLAPVFPLFQLQFDPFSPLIWQPVAQPPALRQSWLFSSQMTWKTQLPRSVSARKIRCWWPYCKSREFRCCLVVSRWLLVSDSRRVNSGNLMTCTTGWQFDMSELPGFLQWFLRTYDESEDSLKIWRNFNLRSGGNCRSHVLHTDRTLYDDNDSLHQKSKSDSPHEQEQENQPIISIWPQ